MVTPYKGEGMNIQRQGTYQIGEARPFTESIRKSWAEGANQQSWNGVTQQMLHLSLTREDSHESKVFLNSQMLVPQSRC